MNNSCLHVIKMLMGWGLLTSLVFTGCALPPMALMNTVNRISGTAGEEADEENEVYFLDLKWESSGPSVRIHWKDYVMESETSGGKTSFKTPGSYEIFVSRVSPWEGFTSLGFLSDPVWDAEEKRLDYYHTPDAAGVYYYRLNFTFSDSTSEGKTVKYNIISEALKVTMAP